MYRFMAREKFWNFGVTLRRAELGAVSRKSFPGVTSENDLVCQGSKRQVLKDHRWYMSD